MIKNFFDVSRVSRMQYGSFSSAVSFAVAITSATWMTAMLILQSSLRSGMLLHQSSLRQNSHVVTSKFTVLQCNQWWIRSNHGVITVDQESPENGQ